MSVEAAARDGMSPGSLSRHGVPVEAAASPDVVLARDGGTLDGPGYVEWFHLLSL